MALVPSASAAACLDAASAQAYVTIEGDARIRHYRYGNTHITEVMSTQQVSERPARILTVNWLDLTNGIAIARDSWRYVLDEFWWATSNPLTYDTKFIRSVLPLTKWDIGGEQTIITEEQLGTSHFEGGKHIWDKKTEIIVAKINDRIIANEITTLNECQYSVFLIEGTVEFKKISESPAETISRKIYYSRDLGYPLKIIHGDKTIHSVEAIEPLKPDDPAAPLSLSFRAGPRPDTK